MFIYYVHVRLNVYVFFQCALCKYVLTRHKLHTIGSLPEYTNHTVHPPTVYMYIHMYCMCMYMYMYTLYIHVPVAQCGQDIMRPVDDAFFLYFLSISKYSDLWKTCTCTYSL